MPYSSLKNANPAIRGIKPSVTLAQANEIADVADALEGKVKSPWGVAISQFKRGHAIKDGRWVKKKVKETAMQSDEVGASWKIMVNGKGVPVSEMLAAYEALEVADVAEATKTVGGKKYPSTDFLVVGDPDSPSTWHLQVKRNGTPDHGLMGAAKAALTVGHRGNKYEGPDKAEAITKLKALYEEEDMPWATGSTKEAMFEAFWQFAESVKSEMSMSDRQVAISNAFYAQFDRPAGPEGDEEARLYRYWVRGVYEDHPVLGEALVVSDDVSSWAVSYTMGEDGVVTFDPSEQWAQVVQAWQRVEPTAEAAETVDLAESAGGIVSFAEAEPADTGLTMTVKLIEPGFGNKKMKRYYAKDMLAKYADRFVGAKMYESEHRNDKDNAGWVSTVNKITGFTDTGAPLAEVGVHDPNFAERVRNLKAQGNLGLLQCSILGRAKIRNGEIAGQKAVIVEEILDDPPLNVDWVRQAGAGGQAVNVAETEEGIMEKPEIEKVVTEPEVKETKEELVVEAPVTEEPKEEVKLKTSEVLEALLASKLPKAGQARIAEREWETAEALAEAIKAEEDYIANLVEAGKPFGLGATEPKEAKKDERPIAERERDALHRAGL